MLNQAAASVATDEAVRAMLATRIDGAFRLATFILHDRMAAEEAVQEAALLAWRRRRTLRDPQAADGWFTRILVNVCRDELRRRPARALIVALDTMVDGVVRSGPSSGHGDLGTALQTLTPDEQVLLALRFGRDLTVPDIATHLGVPEGTVKSRLHTAIRHLRAALDAERRLEATR